VKSGEIHPVTSGEADYTVQEKQIKKEVENIVAVAPLRYDTILRRLLVNPISEE
jgi:hypothetical protein